MFSGSAELWGSGPDPPKFKHCTSVQERGVFPHPMFKMPHAPTGSAHDSGRIPCYRGIFQIPPDFVVKSQAIDIIGLILPLIRGQNVIETSRRHMKSRFELLSPSKGNWFTTKSDGMWKSQLRAISRESCSMSQYCKRSLQLRRLCGCKYVQQSVTS